MLVGNRLPVIWFDLSHQVLWIYRQILVQISAMTSAMLVLLLNTLLVVSTYAASVYPTTQWAFTEGKANEPSTMLTNSLQSPWDGVKFDFINGTSYQQWYFDVVSYDLLSSITVEFNIHTPPGSSIASEIPAYVSVNGKLPNGELFSISAIPATNITVNTVGQGSSRYWIVKSGMELVVIREHQILHFVFSE
jgi:hypothetical protein